MTGEYKIVICFDSKGKELLEYSLPSVREAIDLACEIVFHRIRADMYKFLGVTPCRWIRWKQGRGLLGKETVQRLVDLLGISEETIHRTGESERGAWVKHNMARRERKKRERKLYMWSETIDPEGDDEDGE